MYKNIKIFKLYNFNKIIIVLIVISFFLYSCDILLDNNFNGIWVKTAERCNAIGKCSNELKNFEYREMMKSEGFLQLKEYFQIQQNEIIRHIYTKILDYSTNKSNIYYENDTYQLIKHSNVKYNLKKNKEIIFEIIRISNKEFLLKQLPSKDDYPWICERYNTCYDKYIFTDKIEGNKFTK